MVPQTPPGPGGHSRANLPVTGCAPFAREHPSDRPVRPSRSDGDGDDGRAEEVTPEHYEYCGLYLRGLSKDAAVDLVGQAAATALDGVAHLNGLEIEVMRNPGSFRTQRTSPPGQSRSRSSSSRPHPARWWTRSRNSSPSPGKPDTRQSPQATTKTSSPQTAGTAGGSVGATVGATGPDGEDRSERVRTRRRSSAQRADGFGRRQ